ncbi:MAG: glycosyltransferase [Bacteroidales bacterium]
MAGDIKASVVMNSYKEKPEYFVQAAESYLNQKGVSVELIVSTVRGDRCIELCKQYPVKIVVSETPGIWHQLNAGMQKTTGDWIVYASSNDVSIPEKLITEINRCIKIGKEVCYSTFHRCNKDLKITNTVTLGEYDYESHLKKNYVSDCSLFSKRLKDKYLPFKEEYGNSAYHDFWLRIYEGEGNVFTYNPQPTWHYRIYNESRHILKKTNKELLAKEKKQKEKMLKSHEK